MIKIQNDNLIKHYNQAIQFKKCKIKIIGYL